MRKEESKKVKDSLEKLGLHPVGELVDGGERREGGEEEREDGAGVGGAERGRGERGGEDREGRIV